MTLWIVLTVMTAVVAVLLTVPIVRAYDRPRGAATNIAILKEQLSSIDRDCAEGNLTAEQAERSRAEINRRIVAEGRVADAPRRQLDSKTLPWVAVGVAAVIALGATGLYAQLGRPDLGSSNTGAPVSGDADQRQIADIAKMIPQLEAKLAQDPSNAEGWRMLGWSYLVVGRASDSAHAYGRAVALEPANASYRSAQGDAIVQAANGQVTPAALEAFRAALKIDPNDARSRYYMALYEDQQGRRDRAMADWVALIKSAPPDAPWLGQVRDFVERVARDRHVDISKEIGSDGQQAGSVPAPGPSAQQVEQAQLMSPADRQAMIHSMVDRLASDLRANPRNEAGWAQLMRARMVLGEPAAASAAYRDAQKAFADVPSTLASLRDQAKALGVPGA
jgi:cytochrome c-type biogenesis protein CcmH